MNRSYRWHLFFVHTTVASSSSSLMQWQDKPRYGTVTSEYAPNGFVELCK